MRAAPIGRVFSVLLAVNVSVCAYRCLYTSFRIHMSRASFGGVARVAQNVSVRYFG